MLNRVCLVGRLTRDPELRTTGSGMATTSFTIAVDDPYTKKNQQPGERSNEGTLFMACTVFGNKAENVAKFTRKGSLVSVEGRLRQRTYTNKNGVNVTVIETIADGVEFLEPKGTQPARDVEAGYTNQAAQPKASNPNSIDVPADDDPFNDLADNDMPF